MSKTNSRVEGLSLIIERELDADRERVWDAWTKSEHVSQWWGYGGIPLHVCEIDLRKEGSYRYVQLGVDGMEFPFIGTYHEVLKPERLRYSMTFDLAPFNENESIIYDQFEQLDNGSTKLIMRTEYASDEALQGALSSGVEQGAIDSMERFAQYLSKKG